MAMPTLTPGSRPDSEAIHEFFGLSYCTHLVLPRTLLQSMPGWWQERFVALVEAYDDATRDVDQPAHYKVTAATQHEASDLDEAQMRLAGVTREWIGSEEDGYDQHYDEDGDEIESWSRVLVPCADPIPPYNRGRTILPLRPVTEPDDRWHSAFESLHARILRDLPNDGSELPQPEDQFWAAQLDGLVTYADELHRNTEGAN